MGSARHIELCRGWRQAMRRCPAILRHSGQRAERGQSSTNNLGQDPKNRSTVVSDLATRSRTSPSEGRSRSDALRLVENRNRGKDPDGSRVIPGMKESMQSSPGTSESLIARIKDPADAAAWGEFVAIYGPVVYRLARRRMQDADAQDIVQQVLLAVSQSIDRWSPGTGQPPFRAWLARISKNAILNAVTRRRPDQGNGSTSVVELLNQQADDDPQTTAELALETRRETLRWATRQIRAEFSENTWRLFWETAVLGRAAADVANSMQRTVGAVYMARFKVMQRLKEKVGEASLS